MAFEASVETRGVDTGTGVAVVVVVAMGVVVVVVVAMGVDVVVVVAMGVGPVVATGVAPVVGVGDGGGGGVTARLLQLGRLAPEVSQQRVAVAPPAPARAPVHWAEANAGATTMFGMVYVPPHPTCAVNWP